MGLPEGADSMLFAQNRDIFAATEGDWPIFSKSLVTTCQPR